MQQLGISQEAIGLSTLYLDPTSRIQTYGTHYPRLLGQLRFRSIPELRQAPGDVIRLSTIIKGEPRTADQMNRTLVHELEHIAQADRGDIGVHEGHLLIYGLAAVGTLLGRRMGRGSFTKTALVLAGAAAGHSAGYLMAPHERQARRRAQEVTTRAITCRQF